MKRAEPIDRLYFDDEHLLDEKVDAIVYVELDAFVVDWKRRLAAQAYPSNAEFVGQTMFIGRLQQSGSKRFMNLEPGIDDAPSHGFQPGRDPFVFFVSFVVQS